MVQCGNCEREAPCVSTVGIGEAGWRVVGPINHSRWLCPDCLDAERAAARVKANSAKDNPEQGK